MNNSMIIQMLKLLVACIGLLGCTAVPVSQGIKDEYKCLVPPAHIFSSVGIEASVSGSFLGKIIPNISIKTDPKVIETGSKALQNVAVADYFTCRLINQFNIPYGQILPLNEFRLFYATGPSPDQFMQYVNSRPVVKEVVTAINDDKPVSGPINGKRMYVDAMGNGSSSKDGWSKGSKIALSAGNWEVKPVGGGWSAWSDDNSAPPNVNGAWTWYLQVTKENVTSTLGRYQWEFRNQKEANSAAANIEPLNFNLDKPTDVYFWVWESGGVDDNRGSLVVDVYRKPL